MRRYKLDISDREFVIDVQELAADRFQVVVGEESYEVTLSGEEALAETSITPGYQPATDTSPRSVVANTVKRVRSEPAAAPAASPRKSAAAGKGALTAPMPGVIIEVSVKAGDTVSRGQQVAVLDAMKMHNVIGAPRDGKVAEVFVKAGQQVDHGEAIVKFEEA